ncbi:hypothetical protein [Kamptonema formosum]|uniref:hypothetical protein n=1 Tax=Kamptonema formosum TaxID=331992 RepID=UPI0012DEFB2F|nr:hypothetical protein [Oscillatoria sp. PCC 10802]
MLKLLVRYLPALAGLSVLGLSVSPSLALVTRNTAVLVNSGSTNTIGYRIYLSPSGEASYVDGNGQKTGTVPERIVKKFFQQIQVDMPLSQLPVKQPCIKSTSFGTETFVSFNGEQSPDVSCPGNRKAEKLFTDASEIVQFLHVTNVPRSQGQELPPQVF